jgi:hypothetical protein
MKNQSLVFDRIIKGNLSPWLDCNEQEKKFVRIIRDVKPAESRFQSHYEIDFYRCFNFKTRYYRKLITYEANSYCSQVIEWIRSKKEPSIVKYYLNRNFYKLKLLLREASRLIKTNDYDLKYIDPYKLSFDDKLNKNANAYVIQLLKTALLKIYLEIQEYFKTYLSSDDYMEIEDLYLQVLSEPIPAETFIKRESEKCESVEMDKFPIPRPKSFKFDRYETNPGVLNDLLAALKHYFLVDKKSFVCDFKKIFSGGEITNPIYWTGNYSELYWFIHLIYSKYKFVEDLKQQQWKVACYCFVRADGSRFDPVKLRNLKRPRLTGAKIERAVRLLK